MLKTLYQNLYLISTGITIVEILCFFKSIRYSEELEKIENEIKLLKGD